MTKATIFRSSDGEIRGFSIKGHAGSAPAGEYDMVCAAISAVGYTALGGLQELCGIDNYEESDGSLIITLPDNMTDDMRAKAQIILETMEIGLRQIENQYPKYIHVRCKEV